MKPSTSIEDQLKDRDYLVEKEIYNQDNYWKYILVKQDFRYYGKVVLLNDFIKKPWQGKMWDNEIEMARLLKDEQPVVAQLADTWRTKSHLFVIYVYYKHEVFDEHIHKHKKTEQQISMMLKDILSYLNELQGLKLVHRQLTPDKIQVTTTSMKFIGHKYIVRDDVRIMEHNQWKYFIDNTIYYQFLAPEMLINEFTTFKSCTFGFACLAYFATHKEVPNNRSSLHDLISQYENDALAPAIDSNKMDKLNFELKMLIEGATVVKYSYRNAYSQVRDKFNYYLENLKEEANKREQAKRNGSKEHASNERSTQLDIEQPQLSQLKAENIKESFVGEPGKTKKRRTDFWVGALNDEPIKEVNETESTQRIPTNDKHDNNDQQKDNIPFRQDYKSFYQTAQFEMEVNPDLRNKANTNYMNPFFNQAKKTKANPLQASQFLSSKFIKQATNNLAKSTKNMKSTAQNFHGLTTSISRKANKEQEMSKSINKRPAKQTNNKFHLHKRVDSQAILPAVIDSTSSFNVCCSGKEHFACTLPSWTKHQFQSVSSFKPSLPYPISSYDELEAKKLNMMNGCHKNPRNPKMPSMAKSDMVINFGLSGTAYDTWNGRSVWASGGSKHNRRSLGELKKAYHQKSSGSKQNNSNFDMASNINEPENCSGFINDPMYTDNYYNNTNAYNTQNESCFKSTISQYPRYNVERFRESVLQNSSSIYMDQKNRSTTNFGATRKDFYSTISVNNLFPKGKEPNLKKMPSNKNLQGRSNLDNVEVSNFNQKINTIKLDNNADKN